MEEAGPGLVYLDVSGLESLIGDDRAVARALVAATERVGVRAAVGLGSSKSVARLAARAASADLTLEASASGVGGGAFRVVPGEEQREFLAALPLYAPATMWPSSQRMALNVMTVSRSSSATMTRNARRIGSGDCIRRL